MKKSGFQLLLVAGLLLAGCKSTRKLYDQGYYERAVYSSVEDLKKNPNNSSARQILPSAYQQASRQFLASIAGARRAGTGSLESLDQIYQGYTSLQRLYNSIMGSPAAQGALQAVDYSAELQQAAGDAAAGHYNLGMDYLNQGGRLNAQKAYENFSLADQYVPGYQDVRTRKDQAYDLAVINVAVNSISQQFGPYSVNGKFLDNDILNTLNGIGRTYYDRFYSINESQYKQLRVDQFMDINLYNIWFGQLGSSSYSYTVTKTISVPGPTPKDPAQSTTVSATVNVTRRIVDSRAAMDCRITDAADRRILYNERFTSQYTWEKLTGNYTGDARALSDKDKAIINGVYNDPPTYDELYRELTRRLLTDFSNRMRQIYGHQGA